MQVFESVANRKMVYSLVCFIFQLKLRYWQWKRRAKQESNLCKYSMGDFNLYRTSVVLRICCEKFTPRFTHVPQFDMRVTWAYIHTHTQTLFCHASLISD